MIDLVNLLENPDTVVAVVGATENPAKYGNIIYRDLKHKGFRVIPVNSNRKTVDGDKAYATLENIPEKPDLVDLVVPPDAALTVLKQCLDLNLMNVWLQPGAEDSKVMRYLQTHPFNYLTHTCIMVNSMFRN